MNRRVNAIAVIQCAAAKSPSAGHFVSPDEGRILFVAAPELAPRDSAIAYRRPDDLAPSGITYRQMLVEYNRHQRKDNPLGLLRAWRLYKNPMYGRLVECLGCSNVFILSAGWGLVAADYLLPNYDITFSNSAKGESAYKRRRQRDEYKDFAMLPRTVAQRVVFFGGKDYVPLFCRLTEGIERRTVFYNSENPPAAPGCTLERHHTATRTNWHYECAGRFVRQTGG